MSCPSCKSGPLQPCELEPGLHARECAACHGHWVPFAQYLAWLESTGAMASANAGSVIVDSAAGATPAVSSGIGKVEPRNPNVKPTTSALPAAVQARVRLCPDCGRFLRKFQLGHGVEFEVDRCGGCAGMWCDAGEWPVLREAGIHTRLHQLFSDSWQNKLKEEQLRKRQEDRVRSILGADDFTKVVELKRWVDAHPQRATLRAFLAEDFTQKPPPSTR